MNDPFVIHMPITGAPKQALLSANTALHWSKRAKLVAAWRQRAKVLTSNALLRGDALPMRWAHVDAVIFWPDQRRRDVANYHPTIKACLDGIVDAGRLPDDSDDHITGPDLRPASGPAGITMTVTELLDPPRVRG